MVLSTAMDLLIADEQCSIRRAREDGNYSNEIFVSADMKALSKVCAKMIPPGAHAYIICSDLQAGA